MACPVPVTTTTSTTVPFLAFAPAAGLWSVMLPGLLLGIHLRRRLGASMRPILFSSFWAANTLVWPLRFGTTVCLGSSMITTTTAAASSGPTNASHHGSHGRWRKVAMRGGTGPSVPTGVAVSWNWRSTDRPIQICLGGKTVNGHSIALPGSSAMRGSAKRKPHSPSVSSAARSTSVRALAWLWTVST